MTAESDRTGFFGPYALAITTGAAPAANLDFSFFDNLGLQGYVPASQRGTVRGTYSVPSTGLPITVGFKVCLTATYALALPAEMWRCRIQPPSTGPVGLGKNIHLRLVRWRNLIARIGTAARSPVH